MKKRRFAKIAVSLLLTLSMLLSLPLYLFAADSHSDNYHNPNAIYPSEPYSYKRYPAPDGEHTLRVRFNIVDGLMYYDAFALIDTDDDTVLREFDIHAIYKEDKGFSLFGVHWSSDGRFVVIDYPHTQENGLATLILDTEQLNFWMPPSTLDVYRALRRQNSALPAMNTDGMRPWMVERWVSDGCVSLLTEYVQGDHRIWARMILDAVKCDVVSYEWGNSADFDAPENPVWTKAVAHGAPAYNSGDFSVPSPDGKHTVIVRAANNVSDAETWNALYEGITVPYPDPSYADRITLPLTDKMLEEELWHDIAVLWSPDGRYVVFQSGDADALAMVYDLANGDRKPLNIYFEKDGTTKVRVIAFSVFDEVLYELESTAPTGEVSLEQRIKQMNYKYWYPTLYESVPGGFASEKPVLPANVLTVKDGFRNFIAVSKTHVTGLDGLFRIGEQYKYLRMGAIFSPYRQYVSDAHVDSELLFDRYKIVRSDGGLWVLDENENTVYAGIGTVAECGSFALTYRNSGEPMRMWRVSGGLFRSVLEGVTKTAVQEDGSVYVTHLVMIHREPVPHLAHITEDGTVHRLGRYDGDLSEFGQTLFVDKG